MSRFAPPDGLAREDLRLLHVYRRVAPTPSQNKSGALVMEMRWRRVIDEVVAEIARTATPLEEGLPPDRAAATRGVIDRLERLAQLGYIVGEEPQFSLYKLTQQGTALLERWKKAGYR